MTYPVIVDDVSTDKAISCKSRWCPFALVQVGATAANRTDKGLPIVGTGCLGSMCMKWQYIDNRQGQTKGVCGMDSVPVIMEETVDSLPAPGTAGIPGEKAIPLSLKPRPGRGKDYIAPLNEAPPQS